MTARESVPHRLTWTRWLLAVWEGVLMLWFLMMCFFIIGLPLKHPEIFGLDAVKTAAQLPLLVRVLKDAMFESGMGVLVLMAGLSVAFGAVTLVSRESAASRFFRWVVISVVSAMAIALMPVYDQLTMIGGAENAGSTLWLAVLSSAGLVVAGLGIGWTRSQVVSGDH